MNRILFNYSLKNVALPKPDIYRRNLIEKTENLVRRMRWRAHFFLNATNAKNSNIFGLKSSKHAPQVNELKNFEDDLTLMIENVKFRKVNDQFLKTLEEDLKKIDSSPNLFVFADKTRNIYEMKPDDYNKLLTENITVNYKQGNEAIIEEINTELKDICESFDISC